MQPTMQETWIYIDCEDRQRKDSKPVLGNGERNCRQNDNTFAQAERSKRWASTIVVTNNIRLERILLHSSATSSVSPGIVNWTPSCVTGTPAVAKRRLAAHAEPCCKKLTMWFNANSGRGTNHSRKHRGKTYI